MSQPRLVVRRQAYVLVLFMLLGAACGSSATDRYERRVLRIEDEVFDRIAAASQLPSDPEMDLEASLRATKEAIEASRWAVDQLMAMDPPDQYARGHAILIRYYRTGIEFSEAERQVAIRRSRNKDATSAERRRDSIGEIVLDLRRIVADELPFVRGLEFPD